MPPKSSSCVCLHQPPAEKRRPRFRRVWVLNSTGCNCYTKQHARVGVTACVKPMRRQEALTSIKVEWRMMERQQTQWRWQHWQVGGLLFVLCRPWGSGCSPVTQEFGFLFMFSSVFARLINFIYTSNKPLKFKAVTFRPKEFFRMSFGCAVGANHTFKTALSGFTFSVIHKIRQFDAFAVRIWQKKHEI